MTKKEAAKLAHYRAKSPIQWDAERASDSTLTTLARLLALSYNLPIEQDYVWAKERSGNMIQINTKRTTDIVNSLYGGAFLQNEGFLTIKPKEADDYCKVYPNDMVLLPIDIMESVPLNVADIQMVKLARVSHVKKDQPKNQKTLF